MSYRVYDTPAIVVKHWPYGEANNRFFLYTRELGRVLARAQSVRKVSAKLAAGLQTGSLSNVSLVCGQAGWRLVGTAPQRNFLIETTAKKRQSISQFLQLLARLIPEQQADPELFSVVVSGLEAVADSSTAKLTANERLLVLRTLVQLGYAPDPEAEELRPFIHSADYSAEIVSAFSPLKQQALGQINQSLRTIHL